MRYGLGLFCACLLFLTGCGKSVSPSPTKVTTMGTAEVTAKLIDIQGEFPPNQLYDYAYVMKYRVLKVHRGQVPAGDILVGHYNPLKTRTEARDRFSGPLGGNVGRFKVGDVHRLALEAPLDQVFMGGIIDKYIEEKGARYWAIWTDYARE